VAPDDCAEDEELMKEGGEDDDGPAGVSQIGRQIARRIV